jgi:hypothetical protein
VRRRARVLLSVGVLTESRGCSMQYACVVQCVGVEDVLSAFASLMGEFVVCKNSGLGGSITGLLL